MEKYFHRSLSFLLYSLIFLFPFFFLPFTQEFFVTNKLYLLSFCSLFLLLISGVELLLTKKISWQKHSFDSPILLFLTAMAISIIFASPNKVQALLNPNFGLVMMVSLAILYFYLSRERQISTNFDKFRQISGVFLSLITIVFFFQPFKNIALPQNFTFLKTPGFTPVGSQLDLVILLGFCLILGFTQIIKRIKTDKKQLIIDYCSLIINFLALFLTVYSLVKPAVQTPNLGVSTIILPPFRLSWFAVLEVLKTPSSALMGIGLDNFSSVFTRVKDFAYNQSPLWQINAFNVSRSAVLQIFTETGVFGLLAFGLLVISALRQLMTKSTTPNHPNFPNLPNLPNSLPFLYLLICLFIFPPSLIIWFLFFVVISQIKSDSIRFHPISSDLSGLLPIYIGTVVISFLLIATSGYFLGRSFASEYYFKKSIDGLVANSAKQVYDNQRQAVVFNPYIERFRSNFAQTNLLIANNIASRANPQSPQSPQLTEADRQTITQAIQAAIAEGKAVVSLNSQKADGWQNLASIYLNVINAAQGADVWTISSYQRAILADPQNPTYRVGLGGVYYSLRKYDDALKFFEQAISLKPDWPNANYNYAWANFQKENYSQAVNALQNVLNLLDPKLNKADYEKVQKELSEFKKMLPKEEEKAIKSGQTPPGTLNLPTPPITKISPKLELPREASPEAR